MTKLSGLLIASALIVTPLSAYSQSACFDLFKVQPSASKADVDFSVFVPASDKAPAIEERVFRSGPSAVHAVMQSGVDAYSFFAFPADNSGVYFRLDTAGQAVSLKGSKPKAVTRDAKMHGISMEMSVDAREVKIDDMLLGSMRGIRDLELNFAVGEQFRKVNIAVEGNKLVVTRTSLNGVTEYLLEIEALGATKIVGSGDDIRLASTSKQVRMKVTGLTSATPLTGKTPDQIFRPEVLKHLKKDELQALMFLMFKEKLMAGGPRYHTKFGRDSIYTEYVFLTMKMLKPEAMEDLLSATLSSMDPRTGRVSHEQHEGDFAAGERLKHKKKRLGVNSPIEDYKMIDDDFAFSILMATYMQKEPKRMQKFLEGTDARGINRRQLVLKNFGLVIRKSAAFANEPTYENLIRNSKKDKKHRKDPNNKDEREATSQWRDSDNGLGQGEFPFDVNCVFVPAALKAISDVMKSDASRDFQMFDVAKGEKLAKSFETWNTKALPFFEVTVPAAEAKVLMESFLAERGMKGLKLQQPEGDITFNAVSLRKDGSQVKVMHSDDSLMMTFGHPNERYLKGVAERIMREFPWGLRTPVGIMIANSAFAPRETRALFEQEPLKDRKGNLVKDKDGNQVYSKRYHGDEVSWKMQEDLLIFGILRQLQRDDLSPEIKQELIAAHGELKKVAKAKAAMGSTEVFEITYEKGQWVARPFGGDAKANSNQLWSLLPMAFEAQEAQIIRDASK